MKGVISLGLCLHVKILIAFLEDNGYKFIRAKGTAHHIYSNGKISIPVPIHGKKDIGEILIMQILRETNISKNDLLMWLGRK
jgi:predicted RNA binding protein YcfA (HicA-like mRNA interferase family)